MLRRKTLLKRIRKQTKLERADPGCIFYFNNRTASVKGLWHSEKSGEKPHRHTLADLGYPVEAEEAALP